MRGGRSRLYPGPGGAIPIFPEKGTALRLQASGSLAQAPVPSMRTPKKANAA
jgi:hypothetical protein